ncbi:MAG: VanW family protein [bacterium]
MIANKQKKVILFLNILFFITILTIGIIVFLVNNIKAQEKLLSNRIYPNVFIDGQNVGGKTEKEAVQTVTQKYKNLNKVNFIIEYDDEIIATISAKKIGLTHDVKEIIDRAYLIARVSHFISRTRQKIYTIYGLSKYKFSTSVKYDNAEIDEFITLIEEKYNKPAKNALFSFESGMVTEFRPEEEGVKIDSEKFKNDIRQTVFSLKQKQQNKSIVINKKIIKPEITLSDANEFGIKELIGAGVSNYSHSIPERIHNVLLATSRFNGVLIKPDEIFSFNNTIGDISVSTGYKPAYIIKAGKTVLGDGGGVCQVSTTIFRAALNTGLPIIERSAHAYRVSYYEQDSQPGFDATVYSPSVDLKFKNDTGKYILIQTEIDQNNNILTFKFYGKNDGRKVELTLPKVYDVQPPLPDSHQEDPTLKRGAVKQVDFPAWGAKSIFNYKVTRDNKILFQKEFFSSYKPWQAVYLVGTGDF